MKSEKMKDVLDKKIGFIGSGYIAEAIISGIVKNCCSAKNIFISDINNSRANFVYRKYRVVKCSDNLSVVKFSDIIFVTVKPNQIADVLGEIAGNFDNRKLLISVAAGIKISKIEKYLKKTAVIRVMPNTPALIGSGAIAITPGRYAKKSDLQFAKKLLDFCGIVVDVTEKDMDAVTAVSGTGPAYIFYVAEIMRKTAEKLGMQKDVAKKLVNQTLLGASKMLILSDDEPENLRQKVTSQGGTTEAAFKVLLRENFGKIFEKAICAAMKRSKELSNG
ncbi:MAG: pyrroline-5-carboxylate reductase [Elusimicrobiota bacterium]